MAKRGGRGRLLNGLLLLDKPLGISANNALQRAKSIYFAQKAGHTGSLDPLATGMLPICFGTATKFSQFLLDADKQKIFFRKVPFDERLSGSSPWHRSVLHQLLQPKEHPSVDRLVTSMSFYRPDPKRSAFVCSVLPFTDAA